MSLKDEALFFLLESALEFNSLNIIDNLNTGEILKKYHFDDQVIAAGYLHNLPSDERFSLESISNLFGGAVSSILLTTINLDNIMTKEEAHKQKVTQYKELPYDNKAVITSSLINEIRSKSIINHEKEKTEYDEIFESLENNVSNIKLNSLLNELYNTITDKYYNPIKKPKKERINQFDMLKTIMNDDKEFIIEFNNEKNNETNLHSLFNNFNSKETFVLTVNDSDNENQNNLTKEERDTLLYAELELRFLTQITEGKRVMIINGILARKFNLLNELLNQKKLKEEDLKTYLNYLDKTINSIALDLGDYEHDLSIEEVTNYMDLLNEHNIGPHTNYYKIFEALLPKMKKEYVKELKFHLENEKR